MNFMDFDWLFDGLFENIVLNFITLICCVAMALWIFLGEHSNDEKEEKV